MEEAKALASTKPLCQGLDYENKAPEFDRLLVRPRNRMAAGVPSNGWQRQSDLEPGQKDRVLKP